MVTDLLFVGPPTEGFTNVKNVRSAVAALYAGEPITVATYEFAEKILIDMGADPEDVAFRIQYAQSACDTDT